MASIFTFEPEPPRLSSPWVCSGTSAVIPSIDCPVLPASLDALFKSPPAVRVEDTGIINLDPEPQDGPVEYKLHLLLRSRQPYSALSTGYRVAGSYRPGTMTAAPQTAYVPPVSHGENTSPQNPTTQSRLNRLQQLTTQLLWRLQQSSPHHSTSAGMLVMPSLPEQTENPIMTYKPDRLLPGLEGSSGAVYEIGVADDGTLIGLTKAEMKESLLNLRAMAASLGCDVHVFRLIIVGHCQWADKSSFTAGQIHTESLWVVEAMVKPSGAHSLSPHIEKADSTKHCSNPQAALSGVAEGQQMNNPYQSSTEQLRISLTGATASGKSSLLGTLSTGTLDNGRGKSRLSLLRHRHELLSGLTSSVTHELIGYKSDIVNAHISAEVINFASGNISTWIDIHAASDAGRLVFFSDCAGHPRYRRTTMRGLVGWAPHWNLLCVSAGENEESRDRYRVSPGSSPSLSIDATEEELTRAHLSLCLQLGVPLVIVFTKLDLAAKHALRRSLAIVLSMLKAAGRIPIVLPADQDANSTHQRPHLQSVWHDDDRDASKAISMIQKHGVRSVVPILLTSAVSGSGIGIMHSLLRNIPISSSYALDQKPTLSTDDSGLGKSFLFHVEEVFLLPDVHSATNPDLDLRTDQQRRVVVSGHVRSGDIHIGDLVMVGPFPTSDTEKRIHMPSETTQVSRDYTDSTNRRARTSTTRDSPGRQTASHDSGSDETSCRTPEWCEARVVSIRNLRLPVRKLSADQAGTVGLVAYISGDTNSQKSTSQGSNDCRPMPSTPLTLAGLRKGMVLVNGGSHGYDHKQLAQVSSGFVADFDSNGFRSLSVGGPVVVYIASIRASARVCKIHHHDTHSMLGTNSDGPDIKAVHESQSPHASSFRSQMRYPLVSVSFRFFAYREWLEPGSLVLVMPGGQAPSGIMSTGSAGVDGLIGLTGIVLGGLPDP